ncbi:MAG: hypothetical protein JSW59_13965 [Phycisphaerales bacterium]|nr:MAG: hypothetical protein JSW59_13965 [Phycisphaerales bacterium]
MSITRIRTIASLLSWVILLSCSTRADADNPLQADSITREQGQEISSIRSYTVNKKVSDFPPSRDLSTPEAAYATIMRDFMATGASSSEWSEISVKQLHGTERRPVSPERRSNCLDAQIYEVIIYKNRLARVVAKMRERDTVGYDQRSLFYVNGRWLNSGHDGLASTIEEARDNFLRKRERLYKSNLHRQKRREFLKRQPVADPNSYLKPYVEFLQKQGCQPHSFMMEAFSTYQLVVMGEIHNRPTYWAFNSEVVSDPAFAQTVGTIYMELPSNHQENIDRFLVQNTCDKELVIQMLRDFFEFGWSCKPTLDFFVAVWKVNQALPLNKKLRIRLVDMQRPWEKIQKMEDWQAYIVDRDRFMAKNILDDLGTKNDKRNGFFVVGMMHAMEELHINEGTQKPSAGWHLKQVLGDQLFTIFQHAPVMTNKGVTSGRLALGLIDAAFAKLEDRPIAFTLEEGPFGKLPFDGMPDADVYGTFDDGYDAYLYLIPLEDEILSPLIEGFYSDEFMPEIDRRYRLMNDGKPLFSDIDLPTPERVIRMRAAYWGQPRTWIQKLGPENAWHYGDDWQKKAEEAAQKRQLNVTCEELTKELDKIYHGIKEIDPQKYSWRSWERNFDFNYLTMTNWPEMYKWWCDVIEQHPLESVAYGKLSRNKEGLPQIEVTTTLQGGISFSKVFVFQYWPLQQGWEAQYGLDLHLDPKWKDFPKAKTTSP